MLYNKVEHGLTKQLSLEPMYKYKFHEIWVLPFLVFLIGITDTIAQCPLTKSASFEMTPQGIPNRSQLAPTDFLLNISDTAFYQQLTLNQDRFLCFEVGIQEVLLNGINISSGDTFACEEYVWVIDSVLLCSDEIITPKAVAGRITTERGEVVPNVAIGLSSGAVNYFKGTNDRGAFFFENFEAEEYELAPGNPFDNNVRNGISTFDVLLLQKHILNLRPLNSPYKLIAADLNNSGDITAFDMLLLRQMILSVINEFPNTPSWRFVDAAYEFANVTNPFSEPFPSSIDIDAKNAGPALDNRFIAIKMGDLNNTVKLARSGRNKAPTIMGEPILSIEENAFKQGDLLNVPIKLTRDFLVEGLQFSMEYERKHLRLLNITGEMELSSEHYSTNNGLLTFSWTNPESLPFKEEEMILNLQFRATKDGLLSEALALVHQQIQPIIYTADEGNIPFSFDWIISSTPITEFQAFDNYPNPFVEQTNISFLLPQNSRITLSVFDNNGRTILSKQQGFDAGKQTIQIGRTLPTAGLYFYRLESEFGVVTGRMNYIER